MLGRIGQLFRRDEREPDYPHEDVSVEEARFIETAISFLDGIDHRVLSMIREAPNSIIVHTGSRSSPLAGKGQTIRVSRHEDGWQYELVGIWVS